MIRSVHSFRCWSLASDTLSLILNATYFSFGENLLVHVRKTKRIIGSDQKYSVFIYKRFFFSSYFKCFLPYWLRAISLLRLNLFKLHRLFFSEKVNGTKKEMFNLTTNPLLRPYQRFLDVTLIGEMAHMCLSLHINMLRIMVACACEKVFGFKFKKKNTENTTIAGICANQL